MSWYALLRSSDTPPSVAPTSVNECPVGSAPPTGATNGAIFGAKVAHAAWKTKPTWYVVAANDRMIQPDLERKFAKAMNAKTITLQSSHVAMLSHPAEVAKLIIEAAKTAPVNQ